MTRRERLMATLQGKPVDRPAVSFYEIGGWLMDLSDDEFAVWNDPSWRPLVNMALARTDLIRMVAPRWTGGSDNGLSELVTWQHWREGDAEFTRQTIKAPGRTLTALARRDKNVQTVWMLEHLLKNVADVEAYLQLPEPVLGEADVSEILAEERRLADAGVVSLEFGDPICFAAYLFSMEDYTVIALTEPALFHRLLERFARSLLPQCEAVARACPGRFSRICGSEYASVPFLPPRLYDEYVVRYTGPMVRTIQKYGGYARIHSHGRLRDIMPLIAKMKPDGLDPLEPPPQGDMELREIKEQIGRDTVLLGNIEVSDIENLAPVEFEKRWLRLYAKARPDRGAGSSFTLPLAPMGAPSRKPR